MCAEGATESGAESPPAPFGYAPGGGGLSPTAARSYQELRPAPAHMAGYALEEALFKSSTDGAYLRRSPERSPSPERRDDYRVLHYDYAPPYAQDHHHVDR